MKRYSTFRNFGLLVGDLRCITESMSQSFGLIPGKKLCRNCRKKFIEVDNNENDEVEKDYQFEDEYIHKENFNTSVEILGCSPIKSVSARDKVGYGKRKLQEICNAVTEILGTVLSVEGNEIVCQERKNKQCCQKSEDLDRLMGLIKDKLVVSTNEEEVKLLTLVPESWTIREAQYFFAVSQSMVRKAKSIRKEKGLLPNIDKRKGRSLSDEIVESVIKFYENDEYSRMCPGKKEFVSVKINGHKEHKQKRLLLLNLKELHIEYKNKTNNQIGFSKFCELRPKWCILVGNASGLHSVCVCEYHQNAKLLVTPIPGITDYKEIACL